jgi:hypothetical protein
MICVISKERIATIDYIPKVEAETNLVFAIETAISEHEWLSQGGADRNKLSDKFHLISALPYVDEIVSNDNFFRKIYPAAQKTTLSSSSRPLPGSGVLTGGVFSAVTTMAFGS